MNKTAATHIPPGWDWHPACTVDDVKTEHVAAMQALNTRTGQRATEWQGRKLPDEMRECIQTMAECGKAYADIARTLRINPKTVSRYMRADNH